MKEHHKIRVAVLTRGDSLEAWEVRALQLIKELPFAEIVLEVRDGTELSALDSARSDNSDRSEKSARANDTARSDNSARSDKSARADNANQNGFIKKLITYKWSRLFWNRWFKKYGKVNATKELSTAAIFQGVPKLSVIPELKGKFSQYFSSEDVAKVKEAAPDVIIRFGFNILRGEILTVAKHGVWSYHHADHETIRGGPAGFWEYILGHDITGAILQRLTEKLDDGIILRKGYWSLVKHSFRENQDNLLNYSAGWMANALTEIHHHGEVKSQNPEKKSSAKVYSYPGNFRMLQFWFILFGNKIAFHWNNLFRPESWKIGVIDQPIAEVFQQPLKQVAEWIAAKDADAYLADPFAVVRNGTSVLVAEHYSYATGRGTIVEARSEEQILSIDAHASFPNPVEIDGEHFFLPEVGASGMCRLYHVNDGSPAHVLVKEALVDPVLVHHNGIWWLFAHQLNDQNNAALFIYYAQHIHQEFTAHALNPVKTDIRNSRPAGAILNINGKLLRPAQDSSRTYGGAIVINEITDLTPTSFSEKEVKSIEPNPGWDYNKGIHTLSAYGDKTLIDAKSFRFNFANFRAQLKRKTGRIAGK